MKDAFGGFLMLLGGIVALSFIFGFLEGFFK